MAWEPDTEAQAAPAGGEWRAWAPGAHTPPEERQRSRSPSRGGRGPLFSFAAGPQHSGGSSGKRVPLPRPGAAACFPGPELASCSLIVTLSEIVPPGDSSDLCEVSSSAAVIGALRAFRGWGPGLPVCPSGTQRRTPRAPRCGAGPCQAHSSADSLIQLLTGLSAEPRQTASSVQRVWPVPPAHLSPWEREGPLTQETRCGVWAGHPAPSPGGEGGEESDARGITWAQSWAASFWRR